ncbi:hypothetical protein KJB46_10730 [Staphylococcus hominis]|uniref:hypothetical protein n=1 Tax=Staphylococcus hominis TaxID=1290 RepID=UPI001F1EB884|nr:hypothetical protein [Staphylococcus hominis]MCE4990836.1 hypothetical protein [Staphylococcus hominis]
MAEDPKFVVHGSQVQKWTDDIQQLKQERDSFRKQRDELINDMAEVKRKAEAWDKLKKEKTKEYVLRHNQLKQTSILDPRELSIKEMVWELKYDLQRMDELDGTNDFKNLLSDLERGSDE